MKRATLARLAVAGTLSAALLSGTAMNVQAAGAVTQSGAAPAAAVSIACPAAVKGNAEVGCLVKVRVDVAPTEAINLTITGPGNSAVSGVSGPAGSTCSADGPKALCLLPTGATGVTSVRVRYGFALPYGLRVGQSVVPTRISATAPVDGDVSPADNHAADVVKVSYPKSATPIPAVGGRHPASAAAAAADGNANDFVAGYSQSFCGVEEYAGSIQTKRWCVTGINWSRKGGQWSNGWVSARLLSDSRYLDHPTRVRGLTADVRVQVKANTVYGGKSWTTENTNYAGHSFWSRDNSFLGKDPFLTWGVRYTGSGSWISAGDTFSLQADGELYRVQARFRYPTKIGGHWFSGGDSGWWTVHYVNSGVPTW